MDGMLTLESLSMLLNQLSQMNNISLVCIATATALTSQE